MSKLSDNEMEEVLQHFGTKGMRWGVRKSIGQLKTLRRSKMNSAAKTVIGAAGQLKTLRRSKMNSAAKNVIGAAGQLKTLRRSKMNSAAKTVIDAAGQLKKYRQVKINAAAKTIGLGKAKTPQAIEKAKLKEDKSWRRKQLGKQDVNGLLNSARNPETTKNAAIIATSKGYKNAKNDKEKGQIMIRSQIEAANKHMLGNKDYQSPNGKYQLAIDYNGQINIAAPIVFETKQLANVKIGPYGARINSVVSKRKTK